MSDVQTDPNSTTSSEDEAYEEEKVFEPSKDFRIVKAAKAADMELVKKLITEGVDVNAHGDEEDQMWTALNYAAGRGDVEMCKVLLAAGANHQETGRDLRSPLLIAKAASRKEVIALLREEEKKAGVTSELPRPYCKAYYLRDLRKFTQWNESRINWSKPRNDEEKAVLEKEFTDDDIVFIHQDYMVTRSMWHNEDVIYNKITSDWEGFCKKDLEFAIPEDLL